MLYEIAKKYESGGSEVAKAHGPLLVSYISLGMQLCIFILSCLCFVHKRKAPLSTFFFK